MRTNRKARLAMRDAWAMVRRACTLYGGTARQYISEALRIAWAELKANPIVQETDRIIAETRKLKAEGRLSMLRPSAYALSYGGAHWIGR